MGMLYTGEITKQIEVFTEEVAVDLKARGKIASIYNRGDTPVLVSLDKSFEDVETAGDYRIIDAGVNIIYGPDVRVTCDTIYLKVASGSTSVEVTGYKEARKAM
jgi:hypothetical protein